MKEVWGNLVNHKGLDSFKSRKGLLYIKCDLKHKKVNDLDGLIEKGGKNIGHGSAPGLEPQLCLWRWLFSIQGSWQSSA